MVHPRKASDETHTPSKLDTKGSGAITDLADNCFSVWRNKEKERIKQKQAQGTVLSPQEEGKIKASDCVWACDKQRNGDWEGKLGFWFEPESLQYLSSADSKRVRLVEYSNVVRI